MIIFKTMKALGGVLYSGLYSFCLQIVMHFLVFSYLVPHAKFLFHVKHMLPQTNQPPPIIISSQKKISTFNKSKSVIVVKVIHM